MKVLTERQVDEIFDLLLKVEKSDGKRQTIAYAEMILTIIRQAEQVTLKLEC